MILTNPWFSSIHPRLQQLPPHGLHPLAASACFVAKKTTPRVWLESRRKNRVTNWSLQGPSVDPSGLPLFLSTGPTYCPDTECPPRSCKICRVVHAFSVCFCFVGKPIPTEGLRFSTDDVGKDVLGLLDESQISQTSAVFDNILQPQHLPTYKLPRLCSKLMLS